MGRRVWESGDGHDQVKRLAAAGLTATQIARLAGCTVDTVGRYARKLGLQPRRVRPSTTKWTAKALRLAGMPPSAIAARCGVSPQYVHMITTRRRLRVVVNGRLVAVTGAGITALRRALVDEALDRTDGDEAEAARLLGVTEAWLRRFCADPWVEPEVLEVAGG